MDSKVSSSFHLPRPFSDLSPQYRDFIFRKMFEKPAFPSDNHAEEIVRHVRELTQLDPRCDEPHGHSILGPLMNCLPGQDVLDANGRSRSLHGSQNQ